MAAYLRLSYEERYQIKALKDSHMSVRKMAQVLKRSPSSISREIKRYSGKEYAPLKAHKLARLRRKGIGPSLKITGDLKEKINSYLNLQWSPEQIEGFLKRQKIYISYESIYQYIYRSLRLEGKEIYRNLRRKRRSRRTRQASRNMRTLGVRNYTNWIEKRPVIVEQRKRLGDLERDSMLGKFQGPVLLTIVDRVSRLTKIKKLEKINAHLTHLATVELLKEQKVHTITNDNGPEFAHYHITEQVLKTDVYFSRPYCAWQRGTNENTNGLIRQYLPKGTDLNQTSDEQIQTIEDLLNNRPRKKHGFKTPIEVHNQLMGVLR